MPLQPQQTPEAKLLSVKASLQQDNKIGKDNGRTPTAPPMGPEEEDEDIYGAGCSEVRRDGQTFPTDVESDGVPSDQVRPQSPVFHDAQDFPAGSKSCEQCHIEFPASISDEELAKHMQSHFTYECEVCGWHADRETTSTQELQRHRESHEVDEDLRKYCPFCRTFFKDKTPEQVVAHVHTHITN
ncbi:hypothetical protein BSL78_17125 [Apostichopus japonicus]|uniref:C2H2-type domain-containing protein n=1 Tax=Stichopus japonicus TaxID=307972 RepID=A0A2G8KDG5_STIJA|nr:hypothetical protein BSL78_17125 [Apostichopus japonicus]